MIKSLILRRFWLWKNRLVPSIFLFFLMPFFCFTMISLPLKNIIRAAMNSGALGAFLSGSGSSVLAFCLNREYTIGYEMADAGMKSGLDGEIVITRPTTIGTHVVR